MSRSRRRVVLTGVVAMLAALLYSQAPTRDDPPTPSSPPYQPAPSPPPPYPTPEDLPILGRVGVECEGVSLVLHPVPSEVDAFLSAVGQRVNATVREAWTEEGGVRVLIDTPGDLADAVREGHTIHVVKAKLEPPPFREKCQTAPRPYHVVVTMGPAVYERWQSRVMYWWYKKMRALDPCKEIGGFTRLLHGKPDPYMDEIPSVVVPTVPNDYGFVVLNRPYSFLAFLKLLDEGKYRIDEEYILLCEPDHLMVKPLPNMAPISFHFYYMHPLPPGGPLETAILPYLPHGMAPKDLVPTGPSPCLLHLSDWRRLTPTWLNKSFELKRDRAADKAYGWVLEMWGFIAALAEVGVVVNATKQLQSEPSSFSTHFHHDFVTNEETTRRWITDREYGPFIFHLTFEMAFRKNGSSWKAQEVPKPGHEPWAWSWNKRNYYQKYPPYKLTPPPTVGMAGKHIPAALVTEMFNMATSEMPTWGKETGLGMDTCAHDVCRGAPSRHMVKKYRILDPWPPDGLRV